MNALLNGLTKTNAEKLTENGAYALNTTFNSLLDLFGTIGALRARTEENIIESFKAAWNENSTLALKMLFYARDCRGGLGERRTFKVIAKYLANNKPEEIKRYIQLIPEYGRWDDLYLFVGTNLETDALRVLTTQLKKDLGNLEENHPEEISQVAKWLKSENTSSEESRILGAKTRAYLNCSAKTYRKMLSRLRKALNIVETKMSANKWSDIKFSAVPSIAHKNYKDAFIRHEPERYGEYLSKLQSGEEKINAAQLFPYDLARAYMNEYRMKSKIDQTVEAQWKAMPKFLNNKNFLVMCDTSGSMYSNNMLPILTSTSLAIKFAEENNGAFKDHFITFTDKPRLVYLDRKASLIDRLNTVLQNEYVGYNTNLEAAFDIVLNTAIRDKVPAEEMPEAIVIISDMEIDEFGRGENNTNFTQAMKQRFEQAGYKMPTLVYWNVNARADTFHAEATDDVRFVSGSSGTIFKGLCDHMGYSAIELMMNTLDVDRYKDIYATK